MSKINNTLLLYNWKINCVQRLRLSTNFSSVSSKSFESYSDSKKMKKKLINTQNSDIFLIKNHKNKYQKDKKNIFFMQYFILNTRGRRPVDPALSGRITSCCSHVIHFLVLWEPLRLWFTTPWHVSNIKCIVNYVLFYAVLICIKAC